MSAEDEINGFAAFGPADRLKGFDKPTVWQVRSSVDESARAGLKRNATRSILT